MSRSPSSRSSDSRPDWYRPPAGLRTRATARKTVVLAQALAYARTQSNGTTRRSGRAAATTTTGRRGTPLRDRVGPNTTAAWSSPRSAQLVSIHPGSSSPAAERLSTAAARRQRVPGARTRCSCLPENCRDRRRRTRPSEQLDQLPPGAKGCGSARRQRSGSAMVAGDRAPPEQTRLLKAMPSTGQRAWRAGLPEHLDRAAGRGVKVGDRRAGALQQPLGPTGRRTHGATSRSTSVRAVTSHCVGRTPADRAGNHARVSRSSGTPSAVRPERTDRATTSRDQRSQPPKTAPRTCRVDACRLRTR